jgi:YD repeat-containing protein
LKKAVEIILIAMVLAGTAATVSWASETINYTYDARGRLVKAERSGTVNNNVKAEYKYDRAENRTNVNVVSPNSPP